MYEETFNDSFSNGSREELSRQMYCKNCFSYRAFYVTIADVDTGSLKSLHTLFDRYLDHVQVNFEQIVWFELFKIFLNFFFDKKMVNHFWQSIDTILEDVSVTETIIWG